MRPEEEIDQKQLLKLIKVLNDQFKTKIKTKGSIIDLAEAFATGVEALTNRNESIPEEVVDFYNNLFADEAVGYKGVEVGKGEEPPPAEEEPPPEEELDTEPLVEKEPPPEEEGVEELPELAPEEELPPEEEEPPPPELEEEPLPEELDEEPPPAAGKKPQSKKPETKSTQKKENPNMLEQLNAIAKKPELKAFVKEHSINIKLKNNESLQVWKAKIKKLVEGICKPPAPEPAPKPTKKAPAKVEKAPAKPVVKPKAETKAPAKAPAKPKAEKAGKKAKKDTTERDPFGIVVGSLTHKFVQAVYKKPQTMRMLIDGGVGKHPKTLKKLTAMGYMERDKTGIITMTAKGRKVYGG